RPLLRIAPKGAVCKIVGGVISGFAANIRRRDPLLCRPAQRAGNATTTVGEGLGLRTGNAAVPREGTIPSPRAARAPVRWPVPRSPARGLPPPFARPG